MNSTGTPARSSSIVCLLIAISVFLIILLLRLTGSLESLELAAYDWAAGLQPESREPDSRIVLITITDEDIRNQGRWPLPDDTIAQALSVLTKHRPRAIGLDIYRDIPIPPGSPDLDGILTGNDRIVAVMKFDTEKTDSIPPPAVLKGTDQVGFADMVVDPGGIVRRGLLFLDDGVNVFYSFALRLALLYLREEGVSPQSDVSHPECIRLGQATIKPFETNDGGYVGTDSRGYQFLLDFTGGRRGFTSYSLTSLLAGDVQPEAIRDKIVLIGVSAQGVKDFFYTPFSRGLRAHQEISGIALHAHIVSQLLRFGLDGSLPVRTAGEPAEGFWIFFWSLTGAIIGLTSRTPWRFLLAVAGGLVVLSLTVYVALFRGWWIPSVPPAMAWLVSAAMVTAHVLKQERGDRALLMQLFSKHVSREVAEAVWRERNQFLEGGRPRPQRLIASVLFTDLIGFTSISEKMDPQALMGWLNEYMEAMAQQVIEHGGVINKYIGDSIMAVFGIPLARKTEVDIAQDAVNAVNSAIAMERKLIQLNSLWDEKDLPGIGMRIGIFTGPLVAGSLGSSKRLEYTVIGDTVNTASRLESFDKGGFDPDLATGPCRILIGEASLDYVGDQFKTERVGRVELKGKGRRLTIYRVISAQGDKR